MRRSQPEFTTPALVLRLVDYSESDRVVTLLTRDCGKVSAFARGARKSSRRFRGGLGLLQPLEVTVAVREEGLANLRASEATTDTTSIGADLPRLAAGALVMELLDLTIADGQGTPDLYERAERFVRWLATEHRGIDWLDCGVQRMQLVLLQDAGLLPELGHSARDGRPIELLTRPFWLRDGGLIDQSERHVGEVGMALTVDALRLLESLLAGRFSVVSPPALQQTRELLAQIWKWSLDREPRSWELYRSQFT